MYGFYCLIRIPILGVAYFNLSKVKQVFIKFFCQKTKVLFPINLRFLGKRILTNAHMIFYASVKMAVHLVILLVRWCIFKKTYTRFLMCKIRMKLATGLSMFLKEYQRLVLKSRNIIYLSYAK